MLSPHFARRYGPWALVTGASSGLGAEFARQLAAAGVHVVLAARRRERLEELARELMAAHGVETLAAPVDLSRPDFMDALRPALEGKEIGLLVNNAGFGVSGDFLGNDLGRELAMLDVNCRAPLVLTHELAPAMLARGRGGVIFVSSVAGQFPIPYLSHYAATKAWDLYMAEGLWQEWRGKGVHALALCPGATRTEFGEVAGFGPSGGMGVEPVVRAALRGMGEKPTVVAGAHNWWTTLLVRLLPDRLRLWAVAKRTGNLARE